MTPERWKRIEGLYHSAYARPSGERSAFLAAACPDDAALRREVEALLNESGSAEGILSESALRHAPVISAVIPGDMTGRALGGYKLQTILGVGGMGEVYRAHDSKLGRDVAVKVLPGEFTSDPSRLARLEREARMLAALNHPNICGIYGFEEADSIRFLVLELVEGETLAARLGKAGVPVPVHEALTIARQIAEALEVAHERGVIHRDLKPSNIKVTPAGVIKVLDFGLAKSLAGTGTDLTHAPEGRAGESQAGIVIGTAAYMSPEQARGLAVDKRTDIWAFGVVLCELLDRQAPVQGRDRDRHAGLDTQDGTGLERASAHRHGGSAPAAPQVPAERSQTPAAVDCRRARPDRKSAEGRPGRPDRCSRVPCRDRSAIRASQRDPSHRGVDRRRHRRHRRCGLRHGAAAAA